MDCSYPKIFSLLLIAALAVSCRAPQNNTIVAKAVSPDGKLRAVLVDRYIRAALSSDEFFLVVEDSQVNMKHSITDPDIGDRAALIATGAEKVGLQWQNIDTLAVICDACGLKAIDISKKLDHVGGTRLIYRGFPKGTAYDTG